MPVILTDQGDFTVTAREGLVVPAAEAEGATGWALKPEGMCRGDVCVPFASAGGCVDLAAFWRALGHPVVSSDAGDAWALGTAAADRAAALAGLEAPDFALPDLMGVPRRLSELRGKKVFLTTWASW